MCLTGRSPRTHAAQTLQLTRGPEDEWLTPQPAGVSCAEGGPPLPCTPTQGPEPRRKSAAAHRGNPALPGVSAQPGTICPGSLTQRQRRQGGFPLTCCTLRSDLRPETDPSHWSLDMVEGAQNTVS
ncbi:hypothetical protein KUCAC02_013882 [Xyrichtys novacula]|uniref:Uncharacterized protein n=1 Tax=Xyrichtys novacula TaxID=13765 RepID=A0AAV1FPL5_XYRNO|nr:hypothetical protein KUCAC02_013882 [Xyrichtys novacula]